MANSFSDDSEMKPSAEDFWISTCNQASLNPKYLADLDQEVHCPACESAVYLLEAYHPHRADFLVCPTCGDDWMVRFLTGNFRSGATREAADKVLQPQTQPGAAVSQYSPPTGSDDGIPTSSAPKLAACKRCGELIKLSDWTCPHCGHTQWNMIILMGSLSLTFMLGGIVGYSRIEPGVWRNVAAWGAGILGGICLITTVGSIGEAIKGLILSKRPGGIKPAAAKPDTCKGCGKPIDPPSWTCPHCGYSTCRVCGELIGPADPTCSRCGYTNWSSAIGAGIFSMACILGGIVGYSRIENGFWRNVVGWGAGILGVIFFAATLIVIVNSISIIKGIKTQK